MLITGIPLRHCAWLRDWHDRDHDRHPQGELGHVPEDRMLSAESKGNERQLRRAERMLMLGRVAIVALFAWGAVSSQRAMADVERGQRIVSGIDAVRLSTVRARAHYRGFVVSADSAEREAMLVAQGARDSAMRALRLLIGEDGRYRDRLGALDAQFASARARVPVPLRYDSAGVAAARTALHEPSRVAARATIDTHLEAMLADAQAALLTRTSRQRDNNRLLLLVAGGAVLLMAIAGLFTLQVRRRTSKLVAVREATFRRLSDDNPDGVLVLVDGT
ncbi:MAG TPA: hypothetical protein VE861_15280, partial [Gemmatimonadaceae bacterium]|nr:hypothetical protein [Gemmatimonadaceae bacterium]